MTESMNNRKAHVLRTLTGLRLYARLHEAQRVLEPHDASEDHRRELADVQAGARRRLRQRRQAVLGPQALHCRQPRNEHSLQQAHVRRKQAFMVTMRK